MRNFWKKICAWERRAQKSFPFTFSMWVAIGAALGLVLFDNIAIGAGIGAAIGIVMGVADKE